MAQNFLVDSRNFHNNLAFKLGGLIPVVSLVTEVARLVAAVALVVINFLRIPLFALVGLGQLIQGRETKFFKPTVGSILLAIGYNVGMTAYAVFAAIPIIGNIYPWVSLTNDPKQFLVIS